MRASLLSSVGRLGDLANARGVRALGNLAYKGVEFALPDGPAHVSIASSLTAPYTVAVVGAPMSYGQPLAGTEKAPHFVRKQGLLASIRGLGWGAEDLGDVDIPTAVDADQIDGNAAGGPRHAKAVGVANERIFKSVLPAAAAGRFVLTLGGDHSIAAGSVSAIVTARPTCGVIWVDAHADINSPATSPSGNVHGMPLSFLLRHGVDPGRLPGYEWMASSTRPLATSSLVYVGLRDIDAGEKAAIRAAGIRAFTMREIDKYGIGRVMSMAIDHLMEGHPGGRPLHLSYDIDACDPSIAPCTGTRVPGGLNYREAHYVCEALAETGLLGSMDLVEINPDLTATSSSPSSAGGGDAAADSLATVKLGLELIGSALGKSIL